MLIHISFRHKPLPLHILKELFSFLLKLRSRLRAQILLMIMTKMAACLPTSGTANVKEERGKKNSYQRTPKGAGVTTTTTPQKGQYLIWSTSDMTPKQLSNIWKLIHYLNFDTFAVETGLHLKNDTWLQIESLNMLLQLQQGGNLASWPCPPLRVLSGHFSNLPFLNLAESTRTAFSLCKATGLAQSIHVLLFLPVLLVVYINHTFIFSIV